MSDPFESLCGGLKLGEWSLLKPFKAEEGGDGQDADVEVCATPARFYRVVAKAGQNSVGEPKAPFVLSTGSGDAMRKLALAIGEAVAEGMLGLEAPAAAPLPEVDANVVMSQVATIAKDTLGIETLLERKSDSEDFHNLAVWNIRDALFIAFRAGRASAERR